MDLHDIVCLDFEASALGRFGYPIEVAIVDCETLACESWLIKPDREWMRSGLWSEESARVHNISRAQLRTSGQPAAYARAGRHRSLRGLAPRAQKVEMRFAHMKRIHRLDRLRLRGLSGAKDEVLLTAMAQNLRRLAKLLCRSPPHAAGACVA